MTEQQPAQAPTLEPQATASITGDPKVDRELIELGLVVKAIRDRHQNEKRRKDA